MPKPRPPHPSDDLVRQLEEKARELTNLPVAEASEPTTNDEIFSMLREVCPEVMEHLIHFGQLDDINRLVSYVREKVVTAAVAVAAWTEGNEKFTEQEVTLSELRNLIRRIGLNLDSDQVRNHDGDAKELIECKLPPSVAMDLYRTAYPLIVAQGVRELRGEAQEIAVVPPKNLNFDRFWGRVDSFKPGELLVVDDGGVPRPISPDPTNPSEADLKYVQSAIRSEVKRQGHQVKVLRVWPTGREDSVSVDLQVVDTSRPLDHKRLRDVIEEALKVRGEMLDPRLVEVIRRHLGGKANELGRALARAVRGGETSTLMSQATADAKSRGEGWRGTY